MIKRLPALLIALMIVLSGCVGHDVSTNLSSVPPHQTAVPLTPERADQTTAGIPSVSEVTPSGDIQTGQPSVKLAGETLEVYFFDVGQGDCALVKTGVHAMLIDAGNIGQDDLILGYLSELHTDRLDYLVATHPHADHIGSMAVVVRALDISEIVMPDAVTTTNVFSDLLGAIEERDIPITVPAVGNIFHLGSAEITMLAPAKNYDDLNNASLVLKVTFGEVCFLFAGDAEIQSETDQLVSGLSLDADVLKVGHHGSKTSTSKSYLDAVSPAYAIISVGSGNNYGHPAADVLERLTNMGVIIYRTDLDGTISFLTDGHELNIEKSESVTESIKRTSPEYSQANVQYIGNVNSKIFHRQTCGSLPAEKNRVYLVSRDDAENQGFRPCKKCNP